MPWTEKYRPKKLDEIVGQEEIVIRLKKYVSERNMPHLLFSGPPGVGKTTAAICLARELYGDSWRRNFLETNASDERGINVVREKIKDFARTRPFGEAEFKIIFLDEADALTPDAQNALRRTMEMYTTTCRFILSCNYSSKIIEPIQSRTAVFRFRPLTDKDVAKKLKFIAEREGLEITDEGMNALVYVAEGDLRRAENLLQACATIDKRITEEVVYKVTSRARPEEVREMIELALRGEFIRAREKLSSLLIEYGLSGEDLIRQIHREVINMPIDEKLKIRIIDKIGEYEFRLVEGANEHVQLSALLAQISAGFGEA